MRQLKQLPVAVALAGLILLSACGDQPSPRSSGSASSPHSETPVFFATSGSQASGMQALYQGPFVVRNECVLIGGPGSYSVPVWPEGFTLVADGSGELTVQSGDGTVIAVEGEPFEMGGGFTAEFEPKEKVEPREEQLDRVTQWLGYPIPDRCLGPDVYGVWVVGETVSAGSRFS
jgi:hypothetical protein